MSSNVRFKRQGIKMVEQLIATLIEADPIGQLLVHRLRINSRLRAFLLAVGLGALTYIVVPWFDGYLMPRPGIRSSLQDWASALILFLAVPTMYVYYCFEQSDMIRSLFQGFLDNGTLSIERGQYEEFLTRLSVRLVWRGWVLITLVITTVAIALHAQAVLAGAIPSSYNPNPVIFFGLNLPLTALPIYMICMILIRHLIVIVSLFTLFRTYKTSIYALHPDGCGGLAFLGRFSLRGSYFIAILALNISLLVVINLQLKQNPLAEPSMLLGFIAYLSLAPIAFFLPLTPAHNGMQKAKESAQKLISDEADKLYRGIQDELRRGIVDPAVIGRFEELHKLYKLTVDFPVWPLDVSTLRRFVTANIIPLLPALLLEVMRRYLSQFFPGAFP